MKPSIAILIPCFNEEKTIASVVSRFKKTLPDALVYVYDNNSTDQTVKEAEKSGAIVRNEPLQGKGYVVRRMFADVEADVYVMVDGDDTYEAEKAPRLIEKLTRDNLDMVVGVRISEEAQSYRFGHVFGNKLFTKTVGFIFGESFNDILSGYRVFSKRFVKSFPCISKGFEIETELTVHALDLNIPVGEVNTKYAARPEGSESKLSTYRDGLRILKLIVLMAKEVKPITFFSTIFAVFFLTSIVLSFPLLTTYLETGLVPRLPTALLATGIMLLGSICFLSGVILDSVNRTQKTIKKLSYLQHKTTHDSTPQK